MPRLSIIIPCYNNTKTIQTTLNSLLQQSFQDFEIITIDDGSTDNLQEVLKPYGERIRYYYQENQGITAALNKGLSLAIGENISFCDADDYYLDNEFFANALEILDKNSDFDAVFSGWAIVNEQGETLSEERIWEKMPNFALEDWLKWSPSRFHALILRTAVFETFGKLSDKYEMPNDTYFFMSLALSGVRFAWYPHLSAAYVRHSASIISRKPDKQTQENILMWRELLAHPTVPETVRKENLLYQKYVWCIWIRFKSYLEFDSFVDEAQACTYYPPNTFPFDLMVQILKHSWQDNYLPRDLQEFAPKMEARLRLKYPYGITGVELLRWWLDVWWWFYLNYQYPAHDIAEREEWKQALQSYKKPHHYAALALKLLPGAGFGSGKAMNEVIAEFATHAQLSKNETQLLEAVWELRFLWRDKLGVFRKKLPIRAWIEAIWLYIQLFRDSRQSAQRKREL